MKQYAFLVLMSSVAMASASSYSNDFESPVGPEWSSSTRTLAPNSSTTFLGEFGNDTVTLSLTGLDTHTSVTVNFDLYLIRSWDGSGSYGPDRVRFAADGTDHLNATFMTPENNYQGYQSYSAASPLGQNGAIYLGDQDVTSIDNLGYGNFYGADRKYSMSFTFTHTSPSLTLDFQGSGLQGLSDESWGIDNVRVESVPEPMSMAALAAGCAAFARRRRK